MAVDPVTAIAGATGQMFGFLGTVLQPPRQEVAIYELERRRGQTVLGFFVVLVLLAIIVLMYFAFKSV